MKRLLLAFVAEAATKLKGLRPSAEFQDVLRRLGFLKPLTCLLYPYVR
jgi:hypothetical protein